MREHQINGRTMPFGQYAGRAVASLPTTYLNWLIGHTQLREPLKAAVLYEAAMRGMVKVLQQHGGLR